MSSSSTSSLRTRASPRQRVRKRVFADPDYPTAAMLVAEDDRDERGPLAHRGLELGPGHEETTVSDEADDLALREGELRRDRGGDAIAHRTVRRREERAWQCPSQVAVRPPTEVPRVARDDRVRRE